MKNKVAGLHSIGFPELCRDPVHIPHRITGINVAAIDMVMMNFFRICDVRNQILPTIQIVVFSSAICSF